MTDKVKKLVLLNLPYLIFVYLFDKLCQGVRLSPGAAASEKLLHIGQGFSAAFASLAPSFHLLDLCVGAAGAVLIRLAVYSKGKNAKKYRRGIEYGSARWGTPADIAPYVDPDFSQNVLLTQTERITMSSRPKEPKYARNKNILVIGQRQNEIFCQAQPAPVPFLLCGHGPQGHHPERGGRSAGPQGIPH